MFIGFILASTGNVSSKNTLILITPIIPEQKQQAIITEINNPNLKPSDFLLETPTNVPNDVPAKHPTIANTTVGNI